MAIGALYVNSHRIIPRRLRFMETWVGEAGNNRNIRQESLVARRPRAEHPVLDSEPIPAELRTS